MSGGAWCDAAPHVPFLAAEGGRGHGKKMAGEYARPRPAGSVRRREVPHQKPPKRGLTFSPRLPNRLPSPVRVALERAHSGIKRLRRGRDPRRRRGQWARDPVVAVACGLHPARVSSLHRAHPPAKLPSQSA